MEIATSSDALLAAVQYQNALMEYIVGFALFAVVGTILYFAYKFFDMLF